jgi:hypothetical protein
MQRLLLQLNDEGATIFLSSHLLAKIEQMWVGAGLRVDEIGSYRRTLEQVVLDANARA